MPASPSLRTALNARSMKGYGGRSRRDLFDEFDRPALRALPAERFVHGDWLRARVNIDYHVEVDPEGLRRTTQHTGFVAPRELAVRGAADDSSAPLPGV